MQNLLELLSFALVLLLMFSGNIYSMNCFKLMEAKKQIDMYGKITNIDDSSTLFNSALFFYMFTQIPSEKTYPKYYEFNVFKDLVEQIKTLRRFILLKFLVLIFLILISLF